MYKVDEQTDVVSVYLGICSKDADKDGRLHPYSHWEYFEPDCNISVEWDF